MWKTVKHVCLGLLVLTIAYESMLFTWSLIAEHKAKKITQLVATLRPSYTRKDSVKALFQANGLSVSTINNRCSRPMDSCETLYVVARNFLPMIPLRLGQLGWITLLPLPPVKTAYFEVHLSFINGILIAIQDNYHVGATGVASLRSVENQAGPVFRSSQWRYGNEGAVINIGAIYSGNISEEPEPEYSFKYMYSVKCVDARLLWPSAPPPTTELHSSHGCT